MGNRSPVSAPKVSEHEQTNCSVKGSPKPAINNFFQDERASSSVTHVREKESKRLQPSNTIGNMKYKTKRRVDSELLQRGIDEARSREELLRRKIQRHEACISGLKEEVKLLQQNNEMLLTRLSAMAGARLTDGNANIADLSDENRPTKLAEQFSEIYDNEWTEAYDFLSKSNTKRTDEETCSLLLKILLLLYRESKRKAEEDFASLVLSVKNFVNFDEIPTEILKQFKDCRKKNSSSKISQKKIKKKLHQLIRKRSERHSDAVVKFVNSCKRLCWYMVIQDPPVFIDTTENLKNTSFDKNTFKPYTKSGPFIDFIVWPCLYLCEDGNLLSRGVAQGKMSIEKLNEITTDTPTITNAEYSRHIQTENTPRGSDVIEDLKSTERVVNQRSSRLKDKGPEDQTGDKEKEMITYVPKRNEIFSETIKKPLKTTDDNDVSSARHCQYFPGLDHRRNSN